MVLTLWIISLVFSVCLGGLLPRTSDVAITTNATIFGEEFSDIPPWGPPDLTIDLHQSLVQLDQDACWLGVVYTLSQLALKDESYYVPIGGETFRDGRSHLLISFKPALPRSLPRELVLWSMTKIIVQLSDLQSFRVSTVEVKWQGRTVGNIVLVRDRSPSPGIARRRAQPDDMQPGITREIVPGNERANVTAAGSAILLEYEFFGPEMNLVQVFMPTIGALIKAAKLHPGHVQSFIGGFPTYQVRHAWVAIPPSVAFSKELLVLAIRYSASYALGHSTFRPLRVRVIERQGAIAQGGYAIGPNDLPSLTDNTTFNVTTS
ncbi:MAG: hypothetical protein L6R41_006310 [Letrouitia leprolyta]|nr:MAG: hypothetical protein L6R41_006310 [Letrouitia leprolyta]